MTREEFKQLKVGDKIWHPHTGERKIIWVERHANFEAPRSESFPHYPEMTISFEVSNGLRMKIDDTWDLSRTRLVRNGKHENGI